MEKVPFLRPNLVKKEQFLPYLEQIEATRLYSNYGPINRRFEERVIAEVFAGSGAAVTVHNATVGLMLAISQSKRPGGKYALMPSFTFAATPLAAQWCGLTPYFLDVDADSWQMDAEQLEQAVKRLGDELAVVVPYATFGAPMDLSVYGALQQSGIPVVIDAASSFGTAALDEPVQFGRGFEGTVVYSFHATKSFGIGEGGLVYSKDRELIQRIRQAGNFGFSTDRESIHQGLNSKLSEYAAAIALATLDRFAELKESRTRILEIYLQELSAARLTGQGWKMQKTGGVLVPQFIPILSPETHSNREVVQFLASESIEARTYFSPACHQQRQFSSCPHADLKVTEHLAEHIVSLPLWEEMDAGIVQRIIHALTKMESRAGQ